MLRNIIGGTIALVALLLLTGCINASPVVEKSAQAEASASPASEPAPEPEPEDTTESGTRENPVPTGTAAKHSESSMWTFTVGVTDTDGWPEITAANEYSSPPAEGSAFVLAPVHVLADDIEAASDGADPWASFRVEYVTAGGNTYDQSDCLVVLPAPGGLNDLGTMYGGAEADFVACAAVPIADVPGGAWKISSMIDSASSVFFVGA